MSATLSMLLGTAATVGFVHTLIGVDHSLPFVVLARARGWSLRRTLLVAGVCGLAHVGTSVVLGLVGIGFGLALEQVAWVQEIRGSMASWGLIGFGLAYMAWAVFRGRSHAHAHAHTQDQDASDKSLTVWSLFILFALGPCEALFPLMMAPAWMHHWTWVVAVTTVFGAVTVATMLAAVTAGVVGLERLPLGHLERHGHALAGLAIAGSGLAIQALGI